MTGRKLVETENGLFTIGMQSKEIVFASGDHGDSCFLMILFKRCNSYFSNYGIYQTRVKIGLHIPSSPMIIAKWRANREGKLLYNQTKYA